MSESGVDKSAALLLALGEEASAAVLRYLSPLEVSRLGKAMREFGVLPRDRVQAVLSDFLAEASRQTGFATDSERFLDETLKRALGPERAEPLLRRLGAAGREQLQQLAWEEPAAIAARLELQPPQLVAAVVSQLPPDVGAAVVELLPPSQRADTLLSLAQTEAAGPDTLRELEAWLAATAAPEAMPVEGEAAVARLLANMSRGSATAALTAMDREEPDLTARLRARALEFEDVRRLSPGDRKTFLRHVGARTLLHALKGCDAAVLEAVLQAMSPTAAQRLKDDLDTLGSVLVTDIQAAHEEAGAVLRRLAAEGALAVAEEESA